MSTLVNRIRSLRRCTARRFQIEKHEKFVKQQCVVFRIYHTCKRPDGLIR